ncbi:PREDICTED: uncharacterized protein LOC108781485 [Cyphomyrmex costatus]|uniref:Circadian clock-controlled protein n=1 Tax=Cyphomyrmex costatus TaxID=456900 RepID=A0A151I7Y5_9HYME|nr:PREDICTED: uncharacterized protein LOC108781485 [Cyphomyrmex costatus]KYM94241.1 hypothetical protein ALC62_15149 [Cyphomyrmex costatus]
MLLHKEISVVWKVFNVLFAFMFVTAYVTAEIPSYIHPCGLKDPNYDQCIMDNTYSVLDTMCKTSNINVLMNQSIFMDKINIYDTNNLKLILKDIKIHGVCEDLSIRFVHADSNRLHFDFEAVLEKLKVNATYDFDIHILVPLANKGLVTIKLLNKVLLKINLDLKVATKNEKKEIYALKVKTNLDIAGMEYTFDDSEKELVQLHEAIKNVVESNTNDIINIVKAPIEEKISQIVIYIFNTISHSNYEKLFSENA